MFQVIQVFRFNINFFDAMNVVFLFWMQKTYKILFLVQLILL